MTTPLRQLRLPVGKIAPGSTIKIASSPIDQIEEKPANKTATVTAKALLATQKTTSLTPNLKVVTEQVEGLIRCPTCDKSYTNKHILIRHLRYECHKPALFQCALCSFRAKQKHMVTCHMREKHSMKPAQG